ncbi:MAG TPA: beta-propeller fold lactonase family protein [Steroidobacteraceae bacterium]|jgi:DNA-binding beta-propeller fold protein YncE
MYTISASVSGLTGTGLVLQDNGGNSLPITTDGTFAFTTKVTGAYAVTVLTQPSTPAQICTVTAGSGTAHANTTVTVACVTQYTITANVSGLAGTGLVLQDNGVDNLSVTTDGMHPFATAVAAGGNYAVTVFVQPTAPAQSCTVTTGSGVANAAVTVAVTCVTQYTISANVTGLTGSGLVLQDNGGDNLTVTTAGTHAFATTVAAGGAYAVTVLTQPSTPAQFCRVTAGAGTAGGNVTVAVNCLNVGIHVFVANPFDGTDGSVAAFNITASTGALVAATGSPYLTTATDFGPTALAVDPSGAYLYSANQGLPLPAPHPTGAGISTWGIDANGVLHPDAVVGSPFASGGIDNSPDALAIDPAGPYLYAASNDNPTGTVEGFSLAAGILTALNSQVEGNVPFSLAVDTTNKFVWAPNGNDGSIGEFTLTAGMLSVPGYSGAITNPYAIVVDPTGTYLYITDNIANTVQRFTYNAGSGSLTAHGIGVSTGAGNGAPTGAAIDPTGSFLFVANSGTGKVAAFTISAVDGSLTAVAGSPFTASGTASPNTPTAVAVDPSGQYLYVANGDAGTISVFKITAGTGVLTAVNLAVPCVSSGGGPQSIVVQ